MVEQKIDNIETLIHELNTFPSHYIYRGQADASWGIQSSLERNIGDNFSKLQAVKYEEFSLQHFKSKFHLYDRENILPVSKLAWLSIMQHYGVPTRLIDFTESPYVAIYFALETYSPHSENDFSVYAIDYRATMKQSLAAISDHDKDFKETYESLYDKHDSVFEDYVDRYSYNILWITEPNQMNIRLDRQAGSFLLSGNSGERVETLMASSTYDTVDIRKLTIDHSLYKSVFALLKKMNITSKSLYGDLDGLARAIRMELQVRSV